MSSAEKVGAGKDTSISIMEAIREAAVHRGFRLLTLGFFVCGFHVAFIAVHLPAYLVDNGASVTLGAKALMLIALFNMAGAWGSGWLAGRISCLADERIDSDFVCFVIRLAMAEHNTSYIGPCFANFWHSLHGNSLWCCILRASSWKFYRGLAWWFNLRHHWGLCHYLGNGDCAWSCQRRASSSDQ